LQRIQPKYATPNFSSNKIINGYNKRWNLKFARKHQQI
jgi:hypothetical protein